MWVRGCRLRQGAIAAFVRGGRAVECARLIIGRRETFTGSNPVLSAKPLVSSTRCCCCVTWTINLPLRQLNGSNSPPAIYWFQKRPAILIPLFGKVQVLNSFVIVGRYRLCLKSRNPVGRSANGAKYDSQGQARSASPLGYRKPIEESTESAKYLRYYCALSELHGCLRVDPGATRLALLGACPWLSYSAPLALRGLISDF